MNRRMREAIGRQAPMWFRMLATSGSLVLHLLVLDRLLQGTEVLPEVRTLRPLTVEVELLESATEPAPPPPSTPPVVVAASPPARQPAVSKRPVAAPVAAPLSGSPAVAAPVPPPVAAPVDLDAQRQAVAAEIAREQLPPRRAFAGRSLDAMLPDADSGRLPGFRPRAGEGARGIVDKLGGMLMQRLPSAAIDPDAVLDPLTERWEEAHHGSDLAACERQYPDVDREMRRQLCGEVRPPR